MLQPAPFPASRPRRLRQAPWIRSMVAENVLTPADFIWPCFVIEGKDKAEPVPSMPGVERLTVDRLVAKAQEAHDLGLIHHMVPGYEEVMPKARAVAEALAAKPPMAMRLTKRSLREMTQRDYDDAFARGEEIEAAAYEAGEPQEYMRRFFAERQAKKQG